jgi:hypothetical protein
MSDEYPNEETRKIIEWREAVGEIKQDDNTTLPRLVKQTDTKTLMGVFQSYNDMLEDHRGSPDVAFWSAWDEEVMHSVPRRTSSAGPCRTDW